VLLDKSIAAMTAAIEVINKPKFEYREEVYLMLCVNAWELMLKAKWLSFNGNNEKSLYVKIQPRNKDGRPSKREVYKKNRCGNPLTHEITHVINQIDAKIGAVDVNVKNNLMALVEARDNCIHFYNSSANIDKIIREIGLANIKNYILQVQEWFGVSPESLCDYLLTISIISTPASTQALLGNIEEQQFINYILKLSGQQKQDSEKSVALTLDIKFNKSSNPGSIPIEITKTGAVAKIELTDEQIRDKYPHTYTEMIALFKARYSNFKVDSKFRALKVKIISDEKFSKIRMLDPLKPKSNNKTFYNNNIFTYFDQHYVKK
jgi:hypothetical protein